MSAFIVVRIIMIIIIMIVLGRILITIICRKDSGKDVLWSKTDYTNKGFSKLMNNSLKYDYYSLNPCKCN